MSQALVRAAFETTLNAWALAQNPVIPIAWENVVFPRTSARYLRASLLPGSSFTQDLLGLHRRYQGLFQVNVCTPAQGGMVAAETLIASLDALFQPQTAILSAGLRVWIIQPISPAPALSDDTHQIIPVTIQYRADTIS